MQKNISVIKSNINYLEEGIDLLEQLTDTQFSGNKGKYFKSGVGKHIRHTIEHYTSFLDGHQSKINYDNRERDPNLENDRAFAISTMRNIVGELDAFLRNPDLLEKEVEVQSNEPVDEEGLPYSKSTIRRELQYLISHTLHHYALVAVYLKTLGYEPKETFGVAPSTLKYEKRLPKAY